HWKFSSNKDSWIVSAQVGYRFKGGVRVEAEYAYRAGDVGSVMGSALRGQPIGLCSTSVAPPGCGHASGHLDVHTIMANVLFDFPISGPIVPYIGGGIGDGIVDQHIQGRLSGPAPGAPALTNVSFSGS